MYQIDDKRVSADEFDRSRDDLCRLVLGRKKRSAFRVAHPSYEASYEENAEPRKERHIVCHVRHGIHLKANRQEYEVVRRIVKPFQFASEGSKKRSCHTDQGIDQLGVSLSRLFKLLDERIQKYAHSEHGKHVEYDEAVYLQICRDKPGRKCQTCSNTQELEAPEQIILGERAADSGYSDKYDDEERMDYCPEPVGFKESESINAVLVADIPCGMHEDHHDQRETAQEVELISSLLLLICHRRHSPARQLPIAVANTASSGIMKLAL